MKGLIWKYLFVVVVLAGCGMVSVPVPEGGFQPQSVATVPRDFAKWADLWTGTLKNTRTSTKDVTISFRKFNNDGTVEIDYCHGSLLWIEGRHTYNDGDHGCFKPATQIVGDTMTMQFSNGDSAVCKISADGSAMHEVYSKNKYLPLIGDLYRAKH